MLRQRKPENVILRTDRGSQLNHFMQSKKKKKFIARSIVIFLKLSNRSSIILKTGITTAGFTVVFSIWHRMILKFWQCNFSLLSPTYWPRFKKNVSLKDLKLNRDNFHLINRQECILVYMASGSAYLHMINDDMKVNLFDFMLFNQCIWYDSVWIISRESCINCRRLLSK